MPNEKSSKPRGKGASGIVKTQPRIEEIIARRRERAFVRSGYAELLGRVALLALVAWVVLTYGFLICQCTGQAMFPAMKDGDLTIIFRREAHDLFGQKLAAGDIVAYRAEGERRFGRIVAVGGDTVQIDTNGSVMVNGVTESDEILFPTYPRTDLLNITFVQDGYLYVLGDYRTNTRDSRDYGPIAMDQVEGKVISILRRRGL